MINVILTACRRFCAVITNAITRDRALAAAAVLIASPAIVSAQSTAEEWRPWGAAPGMNNRVNAVATWDPDGSGPLAPQLVAGGSFTTAGGAATNGLARWDGSAWQPFGSAFSGLIRAVTTWDPDGPGPLSAQLVAGGSLQTAAGAATISIARWDGSAWQPLGAGVNSDVRALLTWDPDGSGPLASQLVAGGSFTTAGGTAANRIARWDGSAWQPFGSGMTGPVSTLATWDPDGPGPLAPHLIAGGSFTSAGGATVNNLARWDGSTWHPLSTGTNAAVSSLTIWDSDGPGPLAPHLIAGGSFTSAGGATANYIARWDGSAWHPFSSGIDNTVFAVSSWDPDGSGPLTPQLVAGGVFVTAGGVAIERIASWDGSAWQPVGSGVNGTVRALTSWDPDGLGPQAPRLIACGDFTTSGNVTTNHIARWDGAAWQSFGSALDRPVNVLTTWDPDGLGPLAPQVIAGGEFLTAGGLAVNRVCRWDGFGWQPFGSGMNKTVYAVTTWDPDGAGPLASQVVAGGAFTTAGGVAANHIARWDGAAWQPLGSGMSGAVVTLTTWDPDGPGPLAPHLIAGGSFASAGDAPANNIARWDGTAWQPFGSGLNSIVNALTTWDPDDSGPLPPQVVAGGQFITAAGVPVSRIARWDGSSWQPLSSGVDSTGWTEVRALIPWDPDASGPLPSQLIVGGTFTTAGGVPAKNIARWDGSIWQPLGSGTDDTVYDLTTWDPDSSGAGVPQVVAVGNFGTAGGVAVGGIARWDGSAWQPFGSGIPVHDLAVRAVANWEPAGVGARAPQLVVGGLFYSIDGIPTRYLAVWGSYDPFNPQPSCPADLNSDGFVDDTDFVLFAQEYNLFTVPPRQPGRRFRRERPRGRHRLRHLHRRLRSLSLPLSSLRRIIGVPVHPTPHAALITTFARAPRASRAPKSTPPAKKSSRPFPP